MFRYTCHVIVFYRLWHLRDHRRDHSRKRLNVVLPSQRNVLPLCLKVLQSLRHVVAQARNVPLLPLYLALKVPSPLLYWLKRVPHLSMPTIQKRHFKC